MLGALTPGVSAELQPNPVYWGTKPVWDKLVLTQAPEESTRIAMLKRGEADIIGVSNDNAVTLRDNDGYQLRQTKASTVPGLFLTGYWLQPGPTSDERVREAMDLAINRQEVVDSFFKGFGQPAAGNISLTDLHWGFDPVWYSIQHDPAKSKQLLQEAGYPGKFSDPVIRIFSVTQATAGWEPDLMQIISAYWEAVGIKTQLIPMDFTAFRSAWLGKDPKIMGGVAPWMGIGSGSAANSIPAQQNHMTSKGVNISGNDPQLDKDFFAMVSELDPNKRLTQWHTVQQEAFALHSVLGIARIYDQYAVSDKVGEWTGLDYQSWGSTAFILGLTGVQHR
jgi:peptide/nickel transport system substrate-binding protein